MKRLAVVALGAGCFFEPKRPLDPDAPVPERPDAAPDGASRPNYAFVTSGTYLPGSLGGLTGADAACADAATKGGRSGTYAAWLSTSTTDAIDRLAGARGWRRTDERPVADLPGDLVGHILFPLDVDEAGNHVPADAFVLTGSSANGTRNTGLECGDWNSTAGSYLLGYPDAGSSLWTDGGQASCTTEGHLYCFGVDANVPLDPLQPTHPYGFVTSGLHSLGEASPDTICMTTAGANAMLAGGTYKALLAYNGMTAKSRFTRTGPWYRLDGVAFTSDLTTFEAPLTVTQMGNEVLGDVFFGAPDPTSQALNNCNNWSPSGGTTSTGNAARSTASAFAGNSSPFNCVNYAFYYCVED